MGYAHGEKWNDEKIKKKILEVVENCELDRMPSRSEVKQYYQNCGLTSAISRRKGGWYFLANELGLPIKKNETYFGKKFEKIASEKLMSIGFEVIRMPQNFPYDLLVNNSIKIDVKVSRLYRGEHGNFYSFNLEKPYTTCDILILITTDDNADIKNYYIVPSAFVPTNTQISIGEHRSKYDRFKNAWHYISEFDEFLEKMKREA